MWAVTALIVGILGKANAEAILLSGFLTFMVALSLMVTSAFFSWSSQNEYNKVAGENNLAKVESSLLSKYGATMLEPPKAYTGGTYVSANQTFSNLIVSVKNEKAQTCTVFTGANPSEALLLCGSEKVELSKVNK